MDGAKQITDTVDVKVVGRRTGRAEGCTRVRLDRSVMKILVVVGSEQCEIHCRRKGKGSLTM